MSCDLVLVVSHCPKLSLCYCALAESAAEQTSRTIQLLEVRDEVRGAV